MYCAYQDRRDLEDDLYLEDEGDSDASEANSELEFHLYSQLHYSSNAGALEEQQEDGGEAPPPKSRDSQQPQGPEETADADGERGHTGESRCPSPDVSDLLQFLQKKKKEEEEKKKREKLNKQKTRNPKGPRSFSSFIEEVIVIDSSPDVISISEDDTGDDEGVCTLKGRRLPQQQTSTPAQQGSKKRTVTELVTVDSSTSESEPMESSDSSDSDSSESSDSEVLESWMMLGPGRQDGDQSISLNLKGASDSNEDAEGEEDWLVSTKDKESRICNRDKGSTPQRVPNRYYTNKNVTCRNCNKNGHISSNCPEPKKPPPCYLCGDSGHLVYSCPNRHCKNCGLPGHLYGSCIEKVPWKKRCQRCGIMGHLDDACPEIWRQYHMTTEEGPPMKQRRKDPGRTQQVYCYNCSKRHFGHVCTFKGTFNGTYPISPFINYYDIKKDINERNKRILLKVAELKRNGIFLTTCPQTPEPPNKKQKVGPHNNSYHHHHHHHHHHHNQPNHTPRQSPKKTNHTYFNDSDFVKPAAPKAKKNNKNKQKESHVKTWKPKRAVPASKDRPPPAKLIIDEAKDFPRGGGKGEGAEKKRKRQSRRKKASSVPAEAAAASQGSASWQPKEKAKRKRRARKNGAKTSGAQMYPTDENLFIIKQRKSKK